MTKPDEPRDTITYARLKGTKKAVYPPWMAEFVFTKEEQKNIEYIEINPNSNT